MPFFNTLPGAQHGWWWHLPRCYSFFDLSVRILHICHNDDLYIIFIKVIFFFCVCFFCCFFTAPLFKCLNLGEFVDNSLKRKENHNPKADLKLTYPFSLFFPLFLYIYIYNLYLFLFLFFCVSVVYIHFFPLSLLLFVYIYIYIYIYFSDSPTVFVSISFLSEERTGT